MDKRKQGIAGLRAPMARDVARLSQYSRGDDRNLAHVAPGDTIIPPELMRSNPALARAIFEALADAGVDPAKRVVDSGAARRNPVTGAQEFDAEYMGGWNDPFSSGDVASRFEGPFSAGTAADLIGGNVGYSLEDYYNDLLAQDYYNNVVSAGRGNVDPFGGYGAYAGATGGTGPITDETFYGDPTQRPDYTPDQPTPGPVVDLPVGDLGFDPADIPNIMSPDFRLPTDYTERVQEGLEAAQEEAPVIGPEAPEAPPPATTPPPTQPGRENDLDPVLGIPPEIADLIDIGVEIPIPGPGTELLPVIFGSVQDFIDWTKTLGVDPTGKSYDTVLESIGGAIKDIANTVVDSVGGAIQGATTGRINEYVKNAVLAGQAVEDIIKGATEVFKAGSDGAPTTPPSTGAPGTPGTPTTTTPPSPGGGLEPDFALPGSEEEDEDQAAAPVATETPPAVDVDSEGVPTQIEPPPGPMGPQGPAGADAIPYDDTEIIGRLDELGTNQEEVLGKLDEAVTQGATNQEAIQQVADDLGVAVDDLMGAMGTTEDNLIGRMGEMEANLEGRIAETESSILEQVAANEEAGMARDEAISDAVDAVAEDLGTTRQEVLDQIGATEEALGDRITEAEQAFEDRITGAENAILDQVAVNEAAGMARDEALNDALNQVADDMGVAVEDLMGELGTTREELSGDIADLRAEGVAGRQAILDQVQANEAAGMARDEALNAALNQVADDMGVAVEDLMSELGTTREELSGDIADLGVRLGEVETNILNQVRLNEEAGMARDDALNDAIGVVADDLGMTRDELLGEIGTTRDDLRDEIGASEERLGTQLSDLGRQIGARDLVGMLSQPGVLSQQVDVGEAELADIGDLYSFESIFRTPEQEARFATPYDSAETERLLRELGVI